MFNKTEYMKEYMRKRRINKGLTTIEMSVEAANKLRALASDRSVSVSEFVIDFVVVDVEILDDICPPPEKF